MTNSTMISNEDESSDPCFEPVLTTTMEYSKPGNVTMRKKKKKSRSSNAPNYPEDKFKNFLEADTDLNDYSLTRWNSLLERTKAVRSLAYSSPTMATSFSNSQVLQHLDAVIEFITNVDDPTVQDFQFVEGKLDAIYNLVGEAIDKFLVERREKKSQITKRVFAVSKIITLCSVLFAIFSFASQWLALPKK